MSLLLAINSNTKTPKNLRIHHIHGTNQKVQFVKEDPNSTLLRGKNIVRVQSISGTFLYYAMLVALNKISTSQSALTQETMKKCEQILHYAATSPKHPLSRFRHDSHYWLWCCLTCSSKILKPCCCQPLFHYMYARLCKRYTYPQWSHPYHFWNPPQHCILSSRGQNQSNF